jgi:hypothetical protein
VSRPLAWAAVALAATALAAGCGGGGGERRSSGDGAPTPRESLASVLPRYERAAADQDCRAFARFTHSNVRPRGTEIGAPPTSSECASLAKSYSRVEDIEITRSKEFGTAGVAEGSIDGRNVALIFTLDVDGRWKQVLATPPGATKQIGAVQRRDERYVPHAGNWIEAMRSGNCRAVFPLLNVASPFVTQDGDDLTAFCERFDRNKRLPASLAAQLRPTPHAQPLDLRGTPDFHFFGLATAGGGYWTIIMSTLPSGLPSNGHVDDSVLDYYPNRRARG